MRIGQLATRAAVLAILLATSGTAQAATSLSFDFDATHPYRIAAAGGDLHYAIDFAARTLSSNRATPYALTMSFLLPPDGRYCGQFLPSNAPASCQQDQPASRTFQFTSGADQSDTALAGVIGSFASPRGFSFVFSTTSSEIVRITDLTFSAGRYGVEDAVDLIAPAQALPEPATWGMLLIGFGAIGSVLRFRRRHQGVSFA